MIFSNIFSLINHKRLLVSFLVLLFSFFFTLKQTNAQENGKYKMKTVVIDAGHGGKDPGAVCKKGYEKDIALNIALKLGHYIDSLIDGVKVIYTRDKDEFIELHKRAKIANDAKADLFISIHINANRSSKPIGTETYVMGIHRTKENLAVAQLENSVILKEDNYEAQYDGFDPNSTEGYIIFSLMQNLYLEQSLSFAANVQKQFETRAMRINRGVKQAGFLVLWKTTMPSVLIETGFLSNPDEAAYLLSVSGQDYLASAIFRAFRDYKNDLE
ncbi:MAG: N-acetylmuramoyl-L-alanine amidase [Marinilabiliales bacterium]|nr:MAG: N-acetylmuramoyl-L-alanine amidase [Marinilabiliales bacterium]